MESWLYASVALNTRDHPQFCFDPKCCFWLVFAITPMQYDGLPFCCVPVSTVSSRMLFMLQTSMSQIVAKLYMNEAGYTTVNVLRLTPVAWDSTDMVSQAEM